MQGIMATVVFLFIASGAMEWGRGEVEGTCEGAPIRCASSSRSTLVLEAVRRRHHRTLLALVYLETTRVGAACR